MGIYQIIKNTTEINHIKSQTGIYQTGIQVPTSPLQVEVENSSDPKGGLYCRRIANGDNNALHIHPGGSAPALRLQCDRGCLGRYKPQVAYEQSAPLSQLNCFSSTTKPILLVVDPLVCRSMACVIKRAMDLRNHPKGSQKQINPKTIEVQHG